MDRKNEPVFTQEQLAGLSEKVRLLLPEKRFLHSAAVCDMVGRLADLYDPGHKSELQAAGLLHDLTKHWSTEDHLRVCREYGIRVTPLDELTPKTFHAKTAAALLPDRFPDFATLTVVSAVRWHTTGRAGMTVSERLLYLADYIDDTRKFPDCVALRSMFWDAHPERMDDRERADHLRAVLIASYDMTIRNLLEEGTPVSEETISARNDLLLEQARAAMAARAEAEKEKK